MRAGRGQSEHHVTRNDVLTGDDLRLFHSTDGKTGKVIFAVRVHAGHFCRFAADQRTTGVFAAFGNTGDDAGGGIDIELAAAKIIEEKQGFGPLYQNIVGTHGDEVDTDRIVPLQIKGQLELGANAVGTGDQHRLTVALGNFEQSTKATKIAEDALAHGFFGERLDALDQFIARADIDPGIAVGKRLRRDLRHGVDHPGQG